MRTLHAFSFTGPCAFLNLNNLKADGFICFCFFAEIDKRVKPFPPFD